MKKDLSKVTVLGKAEKAERTKVRAAIGIDGVSGDGKTYLSLMFAYILADKAWEKIYVTDAENKSFKLAINTMLSLNITVPSKKINHQTLNKKTGYSPFNYEYCQEEALNLGCEVVIQDTYSNSWNREGGVLEMKSLVEASNDRRYNDNYRAWAHPDVTRAKHLIFDLIRNDELHIISTLRIKSDFQMEKDESSGKSTVKEKGLKQIQSEGLTYEFDLVVRMIEPGNKEGKPPRVEILKSRYDIFEKGKEYSIDKSTLESLKAYLEEGISIEELNEKTKKELQENLKERAVANKTLFGIFKTQHPDKKMTDLTLEELRELNSDFISVEYAN